MQELTDLEHQATYTVKNPHGLDWSVSVYKGHKMEPWKKYTKAEDVIRDAEKLISENPDKTTFQVAMMPDTKRYADALETPPIYFAFWNKQRILKTYHMPTVKEIEKALKDFMV